MRASQKLMSSYMQENVEVYRKNNTITWTNHTKEATGSMIEYMAQENWQLVKETLPNDPKNSTSEIIWGRQISRMVRTRDGRRNRSKPSRRAGITCKGYTRSQHEREGRRMTSEPPADVEDQYAGHRARRDCAGQLAEL